MSGPDVQLCPSCQEGLATLSVAPAVEVAPELFVCVHCLAPAHLLEAGPRLVPRKEARHGLPASQRRALRDFLAQINKGCLPAGMFSEPEPERVIPEPSIILGPDGRPASRPPLSDPGPHAWQFFMDELSVTSIRIGADMTDASPPEPEPEPERIISGASPVLAPDGWPAR